jgi:quercetin dioxygenase-like cupin family protein
MIMKNIICVILGVMLVTFALGFSTSTTMAADPMPASATAKVLLDNDQVRVLEVIRPPGTVTPMHTHPTMVVYFFSPFKLKHTLPNGKVKEKDYKAGTVGWKPDGFTHASEVIGTADQHALVIEWKKK